MTALLFTLTQNAEKVKEILRLWKLKRRRIYNIIKIRVLSKYDNRINMERIMEETKEKVSRKKIIIILLVVLAVSALALLAVFYIQKLNYYKTHFLPNTYINGADCSELDVMAVAEILENDVVDYELTILGRDEKGGQAELGVLSAEDIGLKIADAKAEAEDLLSQQNSSNWLLVTLGEQEQRYSIVHVVEFDEVALEKSVMKLETFQEENMVIPEDAYISEYKEELKGCEIIPEVMGTQLDVDLALSCIKAIVTGYGDRVDLVEQNCYTAPAVAATNETLVSTLETMNRWLGAEITYDWNSFEVVVDGSLIKDWIVEIEDGSLRIDEDSVAAFVAENASKYDTYGKSRKFTTTLGVELTLPTGGFGWKTDRSAVTKELIAFIEKGVVTDAEPVYSNTAPVHGLNDIGSSYVEADLSNQHLYLYHKGQLVFETDFVSGTMNSTPDCISPAGVFDITYKTTNATLRGGDYEQFVYYWMPFYGNYGMHDATWRWQFGGNIFMTDGSHGCLNLPLDSAATIYSYMYDGYPVICYYY